MVPRMKGWSVIWFRSEWFKKPFPFLLLREWVLSLLITA